MKHVGSYEKSLVTVLINGRQRRGYAVPRMLLSDFLRQELGVTGVHVGCEHGVCGACTILLDGKAVRSCSIYAVQVDGERLTTVEGLADGKQLNALQRAFQRHHGLQCGFCTPGILMSATQFIAEHPEPTEDQVRSMLSGHICRCTGYDGIVKAIMDSFEGDAHNESGKQLGDPA